MAVRRRTARIVRDQPGREPVRLRRSSGRRPGPGASRHGHRRHRCRRRARSSAWQRVHDRRHWFVSRSCSGGASIAPRARHRIDGHRAGARRGAAGRYACATPAPPRRVRATPRGDGRREASRRPRGVAGGHGARRSADRHDGGGCRATPRARPRSSARRSRSASSRATARTIATTRGSRTTVPAGTRSRGTRRCDGCRSVSRCRCAASSPQSARPAEPRPPATTYPGTGPAILDTPAGRARRCHLLGGLLRRTARRRHRARRHRAPESDQRHVGITARSYRRNRSPPSRLRALETGRWVAQVAPTGFSALHQRRRGHASSGPRSATRACCQAEVRAAGG